MKTDLLGKRRWKVNFHLHTTGSDGRLAPDAALAAYRDAGYDAVAVTDHWHLHPRGEFNGMTVVSGVEYNTPGCDAVKVETSWEDASLVSALVKAGIPVMAHIGLRPQQILNLGKFSIQKAEKALLKDAEAVTDAGAFSVVLECVDADLAGKITRQVAIPTIGIGSGAGCDGQILVITDVLGMNPEFVPKHAREYAHLAQTAIDAIKEYVSDVKERKFP